MGARRRLDGVVLYLSDFGDAHRIVHVLTPEEGRLALVARGARASRRRFVGALDRFVSLSLHCRTGASLWTLEAADVQSARLGIRQALPRIMRASLISDCARLLTPEHQAAPEMSAGLIDALDCLDHGELSAAAAAYPRLLAAAGISPDTQRCARCGAPHPELLSVDEHGAVLGSECAGKRPLLSNAVLSGGRPPANDHEADSVEELTLRTVEAHLGKPLRRGHLPV